jgi:hypothetical protein
MTLSPCANACGTMLVDADPRRRGLCHDCWANTKREAQIRDQDALSPLDAMTPAPRFLSADPVRRQGAKAR